MVSVKTSPSRSRSIMRVSFLLDGKGGDPSMKGPDRGPEIALGLIYSGIFRTRFAMTLSWTSLVPPQMESDRVVRKARVRSS